MRSSIVTGCLRWSRVSLGPRGHDGQRPRDPAIAPSSLQAHAAGRRTVLPSTGGACARTTSRSTAPRSVHWSEPAPTWRIGGRAGATPSRYTRVWEPAAIVRTLTVTPTSHPSTRRGVGAHTRLRTSICGKASSQFRTRRRTIVFACTSPGQGSRWAPCGIAHHGAVISRLWIEDAIAQQLTASVLDAGLHLGPQVSQALLTADLVRYVVSRWEPAVHGTAAPATVRTAAA